MEFCTTTDIAAPRAYVFARISDFAAFAQRAANHDITATCRSDTPAQMGTIWDIGFVLRDQPRHLVAEVTRLSPPCGLTVSGQLDGVVGDATVDLAELAPLHTHATVTVTLQAKTMKSRLLLQPLKLAKGKLAVRFATAVDDYARVIADDYATSS